MFDDPKDYSDIRMPKPGHWSKCHGCNGTGKVPKNTKEIGDGEEEEQAGRDPERAA